MWDKILQDFIFVDFRFFCVFRELIFAIRTERFFLAGYICIPVCSLKRAAMKWIDNIKDTINKSCLANLRIEHQYLQWNKFCRKSSSVFFQFAGSFFLQIAKKKKR